jgi:hypothetical protein
MSATNTVGAKSLELTEAEKQDIIDFLGTLNDESFVTNSKFSNPFK